MKNIIYKNVTEKTRIINHATTKPRTKDKSKLSWRVYTCPRTVQLTFHWKSFFASQLYSRGALNETARRNEHGGPSSFFFSFLSYRLPLLFTFSPLFPIFFLFVSLAFPLFLPTYLLANARTCCIRMREARFRGFLLTEFVATGVLVVGFIRCSRWRWSNEFIVVVIFPYVVSPGSYNHHTGPPWWLCSMDNDAEWKTSVFGWLISLREAIDVSIEMIPIRTLYELQCSLGNR